MQTGVKFHVKAEWDSNAEVWVATSDNIPGLATEGATLEELEKKLLVMVPEILEANDLLPEGDVPEVPFYLLSERLEKAPYHRR